MKSTSTMWLTPRPVSLSTVRIRSGGPPKANAALILFVPWPGMGTFRSRGIESIEIRCLDGSVRTSRIESDRAPAIAFAPRLSEPMIRLIWGLVRMFPAGRERGDRGLVQALVGVGDLVREAAVAEVEPAAEEQEHDRHADADDALPAPAPDPARRSASAGHRDRLARQRLVGADVRSAQPLRRARAGRSGRPRAAAAEVEAGRVGVVAPGSAAAIGAVRLGRLGVGHDALMVPAVPESSRRPGALVVCPTPIGNLADVTLRLLDELRGRRRRRLRGHPPHPHPARPPRHLGAGARGARAQRGRPRAGARRAHPRGERVALATDAGMPAVSDPGPASWRPSPRRACR